MKKLIIVSAITILSACGSSDSDTSTNNPGPSTACKDSPFLGQWYNSTFDDTLSLTQDCKGTSSYCSMSFTHHMPNGDGTVNLTVHTTTGNDPICPDEPGSLVCAYNVTSTTLTIDCGGGSVMWDKI